LDKYSLKGKVERRVRRALQPTWPRLETRNVAWLTGYNIPGYVKGELNRQAKPATVVVDPGLRRKTVVGVPAWMVKSPVVAKGLPRGTIAGLRPDGHAILNTAADPFVKFGKAAAKLVGKPAKAEEFARALYRKTLQASTSSLAGSSLGDAEFEATGSVWGDIGGALKTAGKGIVKGAKAVGHGASVVTSKLGNLACSAMNNPAAASAAMAAAPGGALGVAALQAKCSAGINPFTSGGYPGYYPPPPTTGLTISPTTLLLVGGGVAALVLLTRKRGKR
jgi:hypothetical protein